MNNNIDLYKENLTSVYLKNFEVSYENKRKIRDRVKKSFFRYIKGIYSLFF